MQPSQYLLHVNTAPISVSHDLWKKWYTTEHLPDLIKNGVGKTGTCYEELPNPITGEAPTSERPFLAIYDTTFAAPITTPNFSQCRTTSQLFTEEGAPEEIGKNINADARVYELIHNYDPHSYGHKPSAAMMSVEVSTPDPDDFDRWMKEEHLPLYSRLPGVRLSPAPLPQVPLLCICADMRCPFCSDPSYAASFPYLQWIFSPARPTLT